MDRNAGTIETLLPRPLPSEGSARLLLFGFRRLATHGLQDAHAANAMIGGFGLGFRRPLILLRALMAELSRVSNRKIVVAPCCCLRMTAAEAAVLEAVSIASDDPHAAHALLCDVLNVEYCLGALSSAQAVAQAFEDLGRPLTAFSPSC
jgi:hypothetical protein